MAQDSELTADDLRLQSDEHIKAATHLSAMLPVEINRYQQLINKNASLEEILAAKKDIDDLATTISDNNRTALDLALKAATAQLTKTDLKNAAKSLECSIGKLKLALDNLEETRNVLTVIAGFIKLGGVLVAAVPTAGTPIALASIKTVIDEFDKLVSKELKKSLSPDELERLILKLSANCSNA